MHLVIILGKFAGQIFHPNFFSSGSGAKTLTVDLCAGLCWLMGSDGAQDATWDPSWAYAGNKETIRLWLIGQSWQRKKLMRVLLSGLSVLFPQAVWKPYSVSSSLTSNPSCSLYTQVLHSELKCLVCLQEQMETIFFCPLTDELERQPSMHHLCLTGLNIQTNWFCFAKCVKVGFRTFDHSHTSYDRDTLAKLSKKNYTLGPEV